MLGGEWDILAVPLTQASGQRPSPVGSFSSDHPAGLAVSSLPHGKSFKTD
jgi:hypothetical protein